MREACALSRKPASLKSWKTKERQIPHFQWMDRMEPDVRISCSVAGSKLVWTILYSSQVPDSLSASLCLRRRLVSKCSESFLTPDPVLCQVRRPGTTGRFPPPTGQYCTLSLSVPIVGLCFFLFVFVKQANPFYRSKSLAFRFKNQHSKLFLTFQSSKPSKFTHTRAI